VIDDTHDLQATKRAMIFTSASRELPPFALVATARFLLLVNLNSKEVIPLESNDPEYYGISWFPGSDKLVLSHSMMSSADVKDISSYAQSEVGYLSHGDLKSPAFLSQPHQILCGSDGRVICTNTGRNALSIFDFQKPNYFQEARISPARWDRLSLDDLTGDHLNSVFEKNGFLHVIAHRHNKGSALAVFSYPDLQIISIDSIKHKTGLHNIWITEEGQKICCHSEGAGLIDLDSAQVLWQAELPIYTRGLAASSEFVLVGESQMTERTLRGGSTSGLWLLDRKTWAALDYFYLGPYGGVHEVRLVNIKDEAHHGHIFGDVKTLLSRDLRKTEAEEKVKTNILSQNTRRLWQGFELVYGCPISTKQGGKTAAQGNSCLLIQPLSKGASEWRMCFRYSLDGPVEDSHVSVVSYRGSGADRDMHSLLILRTGESNANLRFWIHDGVSWTTQPLAAEGEIPIIGELEARVSSTGLEMRINKSLIVDISTQLMPFQNSVLGVRWAGSTIYPAIQQASRIEGGDGENTA
jgi:hypothetical protein